MKRTARDKTQNTPTPVKRIELSEANGTKKLVLAAVFLALGVGALIFMFHTLLSADVGWQEIQVYPQEVSCVDDVTFHYEVGTTDRSATAEYKELTALYTDLSVKAYQLFDVEQTYDGIGNLCTVNQQVNQVVEVDEGLYEAFCLMEAYNTRYLYYAPIYRTYDQLFSCETDGEAAQFDPSRNAETAAYFADVLAFASDPSSIELQLLGDNKVRLAVSEAYLKYARENHIQIYLDFFVTRNAFVLDYLAEKLQEKGFTRGVLSCDEGFVRNLDDRGTAFSFPVTSRVGQVIYPSATLNYSSPQSLVRLHNYPDQGQKDGRYYEFDDGVIVNGYVSLSDGLCRSVTSDVIGTSSKDGCAPLMLQLLSVYTSQKGDLSSLSCGLLYSDGNKLLYKGDGLSLTDLYADETIAFQAESIS